MCKRCCSGQHSGLALQERIQGDIHVEIAASELAFLHKAACCQRVEVFAGRDV